MTHYLRALAAELRGLFEDRRADVAMPTMRCVLLCRGMSLTLIGVTSGVAPALARKQAAVS